MDQAATPGAIRVRTELEPGDIGRVVALHGIVYAEEYGFDFTFEAYVAAPLAQFAISSSERECIWIAEQDGRLVGSIAIVAASPAVAQLRWFLVDPSVRGVGLGKRLLNEAVAFSRSAGYETIVLWTVAALTAAARLYKSVGFERVEAERAERWGVDVIEERYELKLK
jgi:GNAT superfamily N-acetyltransferase